MIREMTVRDYDAVYSLWMVTSRGALNAVDDSREGIERFLLRNPDTCFVFEENGNVLGTILGGQDGRRGYIYHMAVDERERRRGIGRELVRRVESAFKNEGIAKIGLLAFAENETGNVFWESQGYYKREDVYYRNKNLVELGYLDGSVH